MKHNFTEINLANEVFYLLPHKAIYRPLKKQLLLSDIHLGKASHFRKNGIALPMQSFLKDMDKLRFLLNAWEPLSVIILGDLFHSHYNKEWLWFKSFLMEHAHIQFILVEGNHDIMPPEKYKIPNLLKQEIITEEHFIFSHKPLDQKEKINFCGHVHPGIKLVGDAKQSLTLPCFYYNGNQFILPSFGELTGLFLLEKEKNSDYYLVLHNRVVKL